MIELGQILIGGYPLVGLGPGRPDAGGAPPPPRSPCALHQSPAGIRTGQAGVQRAKHRLAVGALYHGGYHIGLVERSLLQGVIGRQMAAAQLRSPRDLLATEERDKNRFPRLIPRYWAIGPMPCVG